MTSMKFDQGQEEMKRTFDNSGSEERQRVERLSNTNVPIRSTIYQLDSNTSQAGYEDVH